MSRLFQRNSLFSISYQNQFGGLLNAAPKSGQARESVDGSPAPKPSLRTAWMSGENTDWPFWAAEFPMLALHPGRSSLQHSGVQNILGRQAAKLLGSRTASWSGCGVWASELVLGSRQGSECLVALAWRLFWAMPPSTGTLRYQAEWDNQKGCWDTVETAVLVKRTLWPYPLKSLNLGQDPPKAVTCGAIGGEAPSGRKWLCRHWQDFRSTFSEAKSISISPVLQVASLGLHFPFQAKTFWNVPSCLVQLTVMVWGCLWGKPCDLLPGIPLSKPQVLFWGEGFWSILTLLQGVHEAGTTVRGWPSLGKTSVTHPRVRNCPLRFEKVTLIESFVSSEFVPSLVRAKFGYIRKKPFWGLHPAKTFSNHAGNSAIGLRVAKSRTKSSLSLFRNNWAERSRSDLLYHSLLLSEDEV